MKYNILKLSIIALFLVIIYIQSFTETNKENVKPKQNKQLKDNLTLKEENILNNKVLNIENKFNINIKIKDEAMIKFPDFNAEKETNTNIITKTLFKLEKILNKYNKEFFNSFYNNDYNGLNIYLTSTLTPKDYETQISNPAAYSLTYNNEYMIVIDINQTNVEGLLCHEIMHNLEFNLNNNNIYAFSKWDTYNPSNFYYNYSYTKENIFGYTLTEKNIENIYFIDIYSHTYPLEDRARIFENICAYDEKSIIKMYPNLYNKALYLKEEILANYPTLTYTNLFNSLN